MPRRPSKKPKATRPRPIKRLDAKLTRWETIDDIPLDEEDAFHASRDKVLLDGVAHVDDSGDDDEVFALKGLVEDEEIEDEVEYEHVEDDRDDPEGTNLMPFTVHKSENRDRGKKKGEQKISDDEEEEETWGRGKAVYYSSNAAHLESDDEEGQELEEQEARRLQRKALEGLGDDDFGLNDKHEISRQDDLLQDVSEVPLNVIPSLPQDRRSLLRHLEKTNPEALALARDWEDTVLTLMKTRQKMAQLQAAEQNAISVGMAHLYYQALLTYATTLAFYLHLRASSKYARQPRLLTSHPIMQRLLILKHSVLTLEDLGFTLSDSEPEFDEDDDESLDLTDAEDSTDDLWRVDRKKGLEPGELDDLLEDARISVSFVEPKPRPVSDQHMEDKLPKKKRKVLKEFSGTEAQAAQVFFDLEEPKSIHPSKPSSRHKTAMGLGDECGEMTHLQPTDAADKDARKKSLRFHTSKIKGATLRRQGARNQAMGGDDDIPYRERQKEKAAKLLIKAEHRAKHHRGEDLDDIEPRERTSEKRKRGGDYQDENDSDGSDGYYELVKKKNKEKRDQKKAEYDAMRAVERVATEEHSGGPRSLTRAILTNKGLTPRRPKAVRNPRVKKRQRFEKAKKKLASQKAIYKGGLLQTAGRYDGEKSGISKVVKSVQLG